MKVKKTTMISLTVLLLLTLVTALLMIKRNAESRKTSDIAEYSEEERGLFSSIAGDFVFYSFEGHESLKLSDKLSTMSVDNDEMYYVRRRQQYLTDAITVFGGGRIRDLRLVETTLKDVQRVSDTQAYVKAYVKLAFVYADDPTEYPTGVGMEVEATLLKGDDGQYRIENYTELSSDYSAMRSHFEYFCEQTGKEGSAGQRDLIDRYFEERIEQLKKRAL